MEKKRKLRDLTPEDLSSDAPFSEGPYYNPWGDCLQIFLSPGPTRRERVDGLLTVYRNIDTDNIAGIQIKGISNLVKKHDALKMQIKEGSSTFALLLFIIFREARSVIPKSKLNVLEADYEHLFVELGSRSVDFPREVQEPLVPMS